MTRTLRTSIQLLAPLVAGGLLLHCGSDDRADKSVEVVTKCDLTALSASPADVTVKSFHETANALKARVPQLEAAFKDACNAIAKELGLPEQATAIAACKPISARMDAALRRAGEPPPGPRLPTWAFTAFPVVCKGEPKLKAECISKCGSGTCDVATSCEAGKLAGQCTGTCEGTCTTSGPSVACEGSCAGACTMAAKSCAGECVGKCEAPPANYAGQCSATCAGGFRGFCGGTCNGTCDGAPVGKQPPADAGPSETGTGDSGSGDTGAGDTSVSDASPDATETGTMEAGTMEAGTMDGGGPPPVPGGADGNCTGLCVGSCSGKPSGSCAATPCMGEFAAGACNGTCTGVCNSGAGAGCVGTCNGACTAKAAAATCAGLCRGKCSTPLTNPICEGRLNCEANIQCVNVCEAASALATTCTGSSIAEVRAVSDPALYLAMKKHADKLSAAVQTLTQLRNAQTFITSRTQADFAAIGAKGETVRACVTEGIAAVGEAEAGLRSVLTASVGLLGS